MEQQINQLHLKQLQAIQKIKELDGTLYLGYPIIGTVDGAYEIDAL
jgi:hypothetical protein